MLNNYLYSKICNFLKISIILFLLIAYVLLNSGGSEPMEGSEAIGLALLGLFLLIPTTLITLLFFKKYFDTKNSLKFTLSSLGLMVFLSQLYFIYGKLFIENLPEIFKNYIIPISIIFLSILLLYKPMIEKKQINSIGLMAVFIISCIQPNEFYLLFMNVLMCGSILYLLSKYEKLNFSIFMLGLSLYTILGVTTFPLLYGLFATASQSENYQQGIYGFRLGIHSIWFCLVSLLILLTFIKKFRLAILLVACIYLTIFDLFKIESIAQFIYLSLYKENIDLYNLFDFNLKNINEDLLINKLGFCSYILINAYKTSIFLVILAALTNALDRIKQQKI